MPTWLLNILVTLAIKLGVPWLVKQFPWIPKEVVDVINELISQLKNPNVSNSVAKKTAISEVKKICTVGCNTEVKKD